VATGNHESASFYQELSDSGFLNESKLTQLKEKTVSGEWSLKDRELASRLVHENWLTEFQARRILNGRTSELVVGPYRILDRLGSGSMGRVFKAEHNLMGRKVALKVIAPELTSNERVVRRFLREMKLVARLDHPNVIKAYESGQAGDQYYIAMELVQGLSLGDMLKKGTLEPVAVIKYAADAALGLDHAHQQGILHRDIKPSNLMLCNEKKIVKVLDLGLGSVMGNDQQNQTQITQQNFVLGTIDYMSPEQASGKELDGRSDLYSLGCCMYHLMSGRVPFQHDNPIHRLALRINGKPTPIQSYLPNLNPKVIDVLEKLLATNAADRYQSGQELSEALLRLLRKKGSRSQKQTESPSSLPEIEPINIATTSNDEILLEPERAGNSARSANSLIDEPKASGKTQSAVELPWLAKNPTLAYALFAAGMIGSFVLGFVVGKAS
jgi:serine/threonine-protein kinase